MGHGPNGIFIKILNIFTGFRMTGCCASMLARRNPALPGLHCQTRITWPALPGQHCHAGLGNAGLAMLAQQCQVGKVCLAMLVRQCWCGHVTPDQAMLTWPAGMARPAMLVWQCRPSNAALAMLPCQSLHGTTSMKTEPYPKLLL